MAIMSVLLGLFAAEAVAAGASIMLNQDSFSAGDTMDVSVAVVVSELPASAADIYLAVVVPDGTLYCLVANGSFGGPNQITAVVSAWPITTVPQTSVVIVPDLPALPEGTYRWLLFLCRSGLRVEDSENWLANDDAEWTFAGSGESTFELVQSHLKRNTSPDVARSDLAELVEGNSGFAFDFYQVLRGEEGNLFYSPYSVSLVLAMTYAGARNETERQMAETLHFTLSQARLHSAFNAIDLELASRGKVPKAGTRKALGSTSPTPFGGRAAISSCRNFLTSWRRTMVLA